MVADSRSSQPSSAPHPAVAIRPLGCATNSFDRNILRVSTFASKILPRPRTAPPQWIQRFSSVPERFTSAFFLLTTAFDPLSPVFSIFYPQPLSIQRFCSCSPANPMIPKDHGEGVYTHLGNQPVRRGDGKRSSITCMIRSAKMTASWMAQCNAGDGLVLSS